MAVFPKRYNFARKVVKILLVTYFGLIAIYFLADPYYYWWLARNYASYAMEDSNKSEILHLMRPNFRTNFLNLKLTLEFPLQPRKRFCDGKVLIFVTSKAQNSGQRAAIRTTWASNAESSGTPVIFVLGSTPNKTNIKIVESESRLFGDILLVNFQESYRNLTLKTYAMFLWASARCRGARFALKTDDDVIILRNNLMALVRTYWAFDNVIIGHRISDGNVRRDPKNDKAWYVPTSLYNASKYPPYCSGFAYLLSRDVLPKLLAASQFFNYLPVEDAFFTGVLAHHARVWRIRDSHFPYRSAAGFTKFDGCTARRYVAVHGFKNASRIRAIWHSFEAASNVGCPYISL